MNELKQALDQIHAEADLKASTLKYLQQERAQKRQRGQRHQPLIRQFAYGIASLAVLLVTGALSYGIYFTPGAYIDVDVNPSIEIIVNRFDRVVDTHAYNADGSEILAEVKLIHRNYREAVGILFEVMTEKGYSGNDSYISVTLPRSDSEKENTMLSNIESTVLQQHDTANIDTLSIDSHVREVAHDNNLSPAKYLAIQELIKVDSTASLDSCRDHSIGELHELTEEHAANHHQETPGVTAAPEGSQDNDSEHHAEYHNRPGERHY